MRGEDDMGAGSVNEHGEIWNDDLAAYALDALEPAEVRAFEEHMADCGICSERLRWMAPAVDVLPATVPPQQPPETLKSNLMDVVRREAEMIHAAGDPHRAFEEPDPGRGSSFLGRLSLRPALAGLGAFLILAAGIVGYAINDDGGTTSSERTYSAKAEEPGSIATGSLAVDGDAGSLHVANMPPTRPGEVYQAWIQDTGAAGGTVHPSSVFVVAEGGIGDVAIPHGLGNARRVMVTREPKGGSEHPSENPVLTAEMG